MMGCTSLYEFDVESVLLAESSVHIHSYSGDPAQADIISASAITLETFPYIYRLRDQVSRASSSSSATTISNRIFIVRKVYALAGSIADEAAQLLIVMVLEMRRNLRLDLSGFER